MLFRSHVPVVAAVSLLTLSLVSCSQSNTTATSTFEGAAAEFDATITAVPDDYRARMIGVTWKPGCPVPIDDMRIIEMNHHGFDGLIHDGGRLMVHEDVAEKVVDVFGAMFEAGFPIRRMVLMEEYGGDDDAAMAQDNTSAFDCRPVTGSTDRYSIHSYGKAIDINTRENPYVHGETVLPPEGREFLDRTDVRPGMTTDGDVVWQAFADTGFVWGGDWIELQDYQHFEDEAMTTRPRRGQ